MQDIEYNIYRHQEIQVIAASLEDVEESPCSHGSEMTVVFVLTEKIR